MSSGDRSNALPLESISLRVIPRTTHNIAWSPDAELAVGCDDGVFIYVPEFSSPTSPKAARPGYDAPRQYNETALQFPVSTIRGPELNRHLFNALEQKFPEYEYFIGGGSGVVTSQGSSINHVVALEWSPCGLGRVTRSVLAVLTGTGILTVYCQGASDGIPSSKSGAGTVRSLAPWVAAWSVGGGMLVPAADGHEAPHSKEYVTAFSWARDMDGDGAVLAYANDDDEIVILTIQAKHTPIATSGHPGEWRVQEVARFLAEGPHPKTAPTDPDHIHQGSSFSLSWSPWLGRDNLKTCMLSYIAKGYVGFRQVTVRGSQGEIDSPKVQVGQVDASWVCLYLAPDAFVVWEDLIWTIDREKVCRGIIATPAKAQAFQLPFDAVSSANKHPLGECNSNYPSTEDSSLGQNPITGLIIHPPSLSMFTSTPSYSLVRLSATHLNNGWHQTNLPLPSNPEDPGNIKPQWATDISQIIEHQLPRALAGRPIMSGNDSDGSEMGGDDDFESDLGDGSDYNSDEDDKSNLLGLGNMDTEDQVHVNRIRIWGMAISPGGGTSAVFVTQHSTVKPERDTFAGLDCRVLFGTNNRGALDEDDTIVPVKKLSTEARMWEWMYGRGPPVPGIHIPSVDRSDGRQALKDHFELIGRIQVCVFCDSRLDFHGKSSRCSKGHFFENCATTGVPILAPGTTNTCGVCGFKCMKTEQLILMAPQLESIITEEISSVLCGSCGGKFIS
ncbi:Uu.00g024180.m01.CDS01 [Anthostomella pinea]|uniref:Uu.00g024180.m01.CDS01 n=1 Tax=Anthostomella pinea TaxID=933095 RepID=A0AAI8YQZ9_9PEZI|nr:Uu.00g024180.m01.CDS01 [Anthostomella pinea]